MEGPRFSLLDSVDSGTVDGYEKALYSASTKSAVDSARSQFVMDRSNERIAALRAFPTREMTCRSFGTPEGVLRYPVSDNS